MMTYKLYNTPNIEYHDIQYEADRNSLFGKISNKIKKTKII